MSNNKDRKYKAFDMLLDDNETSFETKGNKPSGGESKRIRKIHPLGPRVVARICETSNVTDSGLYLPEGAKQAAQESILAEVIEVASALDSNTEEETNVSGIPLGATVLIPKTAGVKVPWDDSLRVVETREILAVVDEISLV